MCSGFATFPLSCTGELDYDNANDLVLEIDKEQLKVRTFQKDGNLDPRNSFITAYSITYPKIILHSTDNKKLCFVMNDGTTELSEHDLAYNRKLLVNCLNQQTRDLIVMCIRVFALKNSMKIDKILDSCVEDIGKNNTDISLELERAIRELNLLQEENNELKKKNRDQRKEAMTAINELQNRLDENQKSTAQNNIKNDSDEIRKLKEKKIKLRQRLSNKRKEFNELKIKYEESLENQRLLNEKLKK